MLQAVTVNNTITATNSDNFGPTSKAPLQRLPQSALTPKEGEALRTTDRSGQERITYMGLGDISIDSRGEMVVSVQTTLVEGDVLREALVRPLLQGDVELDARVHLGQVIDCLIETTSLENHAPDPNFRDLHAKVADHLRTLLEKLEAFAFPQLQRAA